MLMTWQQKWAKQKNKHTCEKCSEKITGTTKWWLRNALTIATTKRATYHLCNCTVSSEQLKSVFTKRQQLQQQLLPPTGRWMPAELLKFLLDWLLSHRNNCWFFLCALKCTLSLYVRLVLDGYIICKSWELYIFNQLFICALYSNLRAWPNQWYEQYFPCIYKFWEIKAVSHNWKLWLTLTNLDALHPKWRSVSSKINVQEIVTYSKVQISKLTCAMFFFQERLS